MTFITETTYEFNLPISFSYILAAVAVRSTNSSGNEQNNLRYARTQTLSKFRICLVKNVHDGYQGIAIGY